MKWISTRQPATRGRKVWNYAVVLRAQSSPPSSPPPSLSTPWYTSRNGYSTRWPVVTRLSRRYSMEIELSIRLASDSRGVDNPLSFTLGRIEGLIDAPPTCTRSSSSNFNSISNESQRSLFFLLFLILFYLLYIYILFNTLYLFIFLLFYFATIEQSILSNLYWIYIMVLL